MIILEAVCLKGRTIIAIILIFILIGCTGKNSTTSGIKYLLAGYMVIENNTLYLDEVEIILWDDMKRIAELGLIVQNDFPNGYYINHLNKGIVKYELTEDTVYKFVDRNFLFEVEAGDRHYSTRKKEEFIRHLNMSYYDSPPAQKVPFIIQVQDGKVISVTEDSKFSI